jgi:hypothetical protein
MMANSDSSPSENLLQPTKEQNGQILSRSLGLEPNACSVARYSRDFSHIKYDGSF